MMKQLIVTSKIHNRELENDKFLDICKEGMLQEAMKTILKDKMYDFNVIKFKTTDYIKLELSFWVRNG